jgi:hypothetical protein
MPVLFAPMRCDRNLFTLPHAAARFEGCPHKPLIALALLFSEPPASSRAIEGGGYKPLASLASI